MKVKAIKEFKIDTKELSLKEKALLEKLIQAAKLVAPLYLKQKNEKHPGANFYPHDATKEEIETAAKKNPAILDPYTFVERDGSGNLRAVPFHIKFQKELEPVAKLLREAAELSENRNFSRYLESRAQSLLDGSYEKSEIIWLTTEPFKFGFVIGPIERYLDKLFFTKCAYQAWVGILDEARTKEAKKLKNIILTSRRKILPEAEKVDVSKLGIRVDETAIFSGLIADFMFTGTNLPNDVNLMEKYGSNVTIFETPLHTVFEKNHLPILEAIFDKSFRKSYSEKELYEGSLRCILAHEIGHSLVRYQDAEKRLKDLFPFFDEMLGYIIGIRSFTSLLLKGVLTQKELEAISMMYLCRPFNCWLELKKNPDIVHYATGGIITLNFLLREGGLVERGGRIVRPDFTKFFICIDGLSRLLEYYLALGAYNEAKEFVEKYGSFEVFESFAPRLEKIKED